jgi:hypothetical protein
MTYRIFSLFVGVIFLQNPTDGKTATHDVIVKIMLGEPETHET